MYQEWRYSGVLYWNSRKQNLFYVMAGQAIRRMMSKSVNELIKDIKIVSKGPWNSLEWIPTYRPNCTSVV